MSSKQSRCGLRPVDILTLPIFAESLDKRFFAFLRYLGIDCALFFVFGRRIIVFPLGIVERAAQGVFSRFRFLEDVRILIDYSAHGIGGRGSDLRFCTLSLFDYFRGNILRSA